MAQQLIDVVAHSKEVLRRSALADIRTLEVESDGDRLVLKGIVGSYFHKQLAQELVRNVVGDHEIANAISVEYRAYDDAPDGQA
jgi:osmotically-inducible protein OsmY